MSGLRYLCCIIANSVSWIVLSHIYNVGEPNWICNWEDWGCENVKTSWLGCDDQSPEVYTSQSLSCVFVLSFNLYCPKYSIVISWLQWWNWGYIHCWFGGWFIYGMCPLCWEGAPHQCDFIFQFEVNVTIFVMKQGQIKTGAPCRSERLAKYNQARSSQSFSVSIYFCSLLLKTCSCV